MGKSNKSKIISIYVTEDLYNEIQSHAENEKLSVSSFLSRMVTDTLCSKNEKGTEPKTYALKEDSDNEKKKSYIVFDEDTSAILQQKAAEQGLNETAYLRNMVLTKDFKVYKITTDDLEDIIAEVHSAISSLSSTIGIIKRQGKGEIFEQDVKKISQDADEIKKTLNKIVKNLYRTRRSAQNKIVRKLEKQND